MKTVRLHSAFLVAAAVAPLLLSAARAEDTATLKFSDPAKPGTLKVVLGRGDVRIAAGNAAEISVKSEAKPVTPKPRKDGLRVISASSSYALSEKDNVVTLDARAAGWTGAPSNFAITVPRTTNVTVQSSFGGDITCTGVAGDLEITSTHGEIRLDDIAGGVVVTTTNGEIRANVRELKEGKLLSFTSYNGEVVLRVPADTRANVRLRTQNGSVLTDFDEKALVTKTESSPRTLRGRVTSKNPLSTGSHSEIQHVVREAVRVSVEAAREIAVAAKEAAEAAKVGAAEARGESPPAPPLPPMPPIPPMTGGQLVTGTLNGGGPEISVATMNGDVTLRQAEKK